jgi:translocator protein
VDRRSGWGKWAGLFGWVALSFLPGLIGSQVTAPEWYQALRQPTWAPPTSVFSPVWTALYLMMGIAAWLVWARSGFAHARLALALFLIQLAFNAAWSWLFFGMNRMDLAFFEIVLLWALILATSLAFWKHSKWAALLLVPYLLWVTFAAALNFSLWQLNP